MSAGSPLPETSTAAWTAGTTAQSELDAVTRDEATLRRFLHGLPGVDAVGLEQRAAELATRGIKGSAKRWAIDTAISMVDLTTLEGADTATAVRRLCGKARRPDSHRDTPAAAAVCVYPDLAAAAVATLRGGGDHGVDHSEHERYGSVRVASVATAFPSGRSAPRIKLAEVEFAVAAGADEVDMVIDRGAFLAGHYGQVLEEIRAIRQACGQRHLKVILETAELGTYDNVRRAAWLALLGGADFVKTSTGKIRSANLPVVHVLLRAVRDWYSTTGQLRGVKPAGGIRTTKDAIRYLVAVHEIAGPKWLTPELFRFGASSLLDDLLLQRRTQLAREDLGAYYGSTDYVAVE